MAAINSEQETEVEFLSGFNADGTLAATAYHTWNHDAPPTYKSTSTQDKWGGTTAGTAGGTVTYSFASNLSTTQQAAFAAGLQLWQDEANISFAQAPAGTTADFEFETNSAGTSGYDAQFTPHPVGGTTVSQPLSDPQPHISIDIASGDFGTFEDNFSDSGRSFSTLVHEEGHMLGLGHSGPYNEGTGSSTAHATYQLTAYDSRQYSDMSYNRPNNKNGTLDTSGAKYDPSIDTANWGTDQPVTPMQLDILSAQRLYGAPTAGALTQAQTFGFNCTITDATAKFFDFTNYTAGEAPVLTLYDSAATGSTLDLSGYASASVVNLNQGAFSNVDGLTANIGIAYGTRIDDVIGGGGNDTFAVNSDDDTIDGGAGMNTVDFSGAQSGYVIASAGGTTSVTDTATGAVDTLDDIQTLDFSDGSVAVCYGAGTLIRTVRGDIAVEALAIGDVAVTAAGARRPIKWLGHRTLDCRARPAATRPVRIAAHAFGPGKPFADLTVSPGHSVCVDVLGPVLIPAIRLVDGLAIEQIAIDQVTYWHVELDSHDVIVANGLDAESYIEMGNRGFFTEGARVDLHAGPDLTARTRHGFCLPFHDSGPVVDVVRNRLRARATAFVGCKHSKALGALASRRSPNAPRTKATA